MRRKKKRGGGGRILLKKHKLLKEAVDLFIIKIFILFRVLEGGGIVNRLGGLSIFLIANWPDFE